jgi:hypothetical protein
VQKQAGAWGRGEGEGQQAPNSAHHSLVLGGGASCDTALLLFACLLPSQRPAHPHNILCRWLRHLMPCQSMLPWNHQCRICCVLQAAQRTSVNDSAAASESSSSRSEGGSSSSSCRREAPLSPRVSGGLGFHGLCSGIGLGV